eukprot:CAMPEP_0181255438 /NCGR_PEP_ID=MMETSP1096-20121128/49148_1 /TAXON_ID=156174 ORGANISM="Chrysochromulina ericina, Strain CCMP281" /NCGR_SAMPLE_ID=MMETSP1096 /ASSEMBLY_ACC=CAM_ASM_000453 /LENGTH=109 /DNA_ID=CAMNT_0023353563 /DNA_START=285 /DNA_END=614 /DNA_ORIENTATION=+
MKELLLNKEAIAINQDFEAVPGDVATACNGSSQEVWVRRLTNGDFAIALTNWLDGVQRMTFCLDALLWPHGTTAAARDVWALRDLGTFSGSFSADIDPHDTLLLRVSPA